MSSCAMRTYQTRLKLTEAEEKALDASAELLSRAQRTLFCELQKGRGVVELKSEFIIRFGITARHFNGCRVEVEGKRRSLKELMKQQSIDLRSRIVSLQKRFKAGVRDKACSNGLKKRLDRLKSKTDQLEKDLAKGTLRLCYGSKKLFRAQFHLEESVYQDHAAWKEAWQRKRNSSFFLLGSKDEMGGNQSCKATMEADDSLSLRVRLPDGVKAANKHLLLEGIFFAHGHVELVRALRECAARVELQHRGDASYRERGQAICYRFVRDRKGWRLFATVEQQEPTWVSDKRLGRLGVDVNGDHLAVTETDRYGNVVAHFSVPLSLYGKSQKQAEAVVGDACKQVVNYAVNCCKPLVLEKLDFQEKRKELSTSYCLPSRARHLSSFAYGRILENLKSAAFSKGIEVYEVNPAYTSMVGKIKFAKKYGLSTHHAAALAIARRSAGFSEKLPHQGEVPDGRGGHIAFVVPARNRQRSLCSHLRQVNRELRAAFAKHFRMARCQSTGPP